MSGKHFCLLLVSLVLASHLEVARGDEPAKVQFNRDVRPILADTCFRCHGPDSQTREAELRLDQRAGLFSKGADGPIVTPGQLAGSQMWLRISSRDADLKMPPPDQKKQLSEQQVTTLRRWIEQGAEWEDHWSFLPIKAVQIPHSTDRDWSRNPIDEFILAELNRRRLSPTAEAAAETLIRRVTLDLTGLPPTPSEIDAFLADDSPDRYERLVDRLLASPRYGEHMATAWLDAARFADTSGYQNDGPREMWRPRDWVINALNDDMGFDQFTIEQLAGDLIPDASLDQQIATGFNRNHRGNSEGGIIPAEYAVEYVVDRVDTTGTVWLGLTVGCARCHSHKFDPISQEEYYQLFAFFNGVPENGRAIKEGNSPPFIKSPTDQQRRRLADIERRLRTAQAEWSQKIDDVEKHRLVWEESIRQSKNPTPDWTVTKGRILDMPLEDSVKAVPPQDQADQSPSVVGSPARFVSGPEPALILDGTTFVDAGDRGRFTYFDSFSVAAWIKPTGDLTGGIVSRMSDDSDSDGWAFHLQAGQLQVNLVRRWLDDSLRVSTKNRLPADQWFHVCMTYDGSRRASGITIYVNGVAQQKIVNLDGLNQSMDNDQPLRIGSTGTHSRLTGLIASARVFDRPLTPGDVQVLSTRATVSDIAEIPVADRTPSQQRKISEAFLAVAAPASITKVVQRVQEREQQLDALWNAIPTSMVMDRMDKPRATFVLERGAYDRPTREVQAAIPSAFAASKTPAGNNRMALAQWIVSQQNPLTARVVVNRQWQRFFGNGIVATSEDFGTQGARPSHPELLDWLAAKLMRDGWSVKNLQRLIVTSATYRQGSDVTAETLASDPENRWLSRSPRFRMSAESIRDQAFAISGLLSERIGGPSVFPYQPQGLWSEIASTTVYNQSEGPDLYRRSLYSYWKRTVTNPTLGAFDAPTREACIVRRSRTNTPLQALTLLNDVTFVEAARKFAERATKEGGTDDVSRIRWMFRAAVGRSGSTQELEILVNGLDWHRERFEADQRDAGQLLGVGDSVTDSKLSQVELAALTAMASVILNLDEVVVRN